MVQKDAPTEETIRAALSAWAVPGYTAKEEAVARAMCAYNYSGNWQSTKGWDNRPKSSRVHWLQLARVALLAAGDGDAKLSSTHTEPGKGNV